MTNDKAQNFLDELIQLSRKYGVILAGTEEWIAADYCDAENYYYDLGYSGINGFEFVAVKND